MAFVLKDRVKQTSTSNGQNDLTLNGSVDGFSDFSVLSNGDTTFYALLDGNNWEVGIGTYLTSGPTLQRTTVLDTSAGNTTKISCSSDAKQVFITQPAGKAVFEDASDNVTIGGGLTGSSLTSNNVVLNATTAPSTPSSGEAYIYSSKTSGNTGIRLHASGSSEVLEVRSGSSTTNLMYLNNQGNVSFAGEVEAAYFVDSSNPSYFLDPSATNNSLVINGNALIGTTSGTDKLTVSGTSAFNSGTTNTVATFTSTDAVAEIQMTDNTGTAGISAEGDVFQVRPAGGTSVLDISSTTATFTGDIVLNTTSGSVNWGTSEGEIGYSSGYGRFKAKNIGTSGGQNQDTVAKWYRPEGSQYRFEIDANGSNWGSASGQYVVNAKSSGFASLNFRKDNNDGIMSLSGRNLTTGTYTSFYLGTDGLTGGTEIWKADDAVGSYGGTAYSNKSFNLYEATYFSKRVTVGADKGGYETALSPHPFELMVTSLSSGNQIPTIAIYNDIGSYHTGLIQYDTSVLKLGLNSSNTANTLSTNTAINIGIDGVGIGATPESNVLKLGGSLTGGIKFNDGTTQSTAASGGASVGTIIALGLAFG